MIAPFRYSGVHLIGTSGAQKDVDAYVPVRYKLTSWTLSTYTPSAPGWSRSGGMSITSGLRSCSLVRLRVSPFARSHADTDHNLLRGICAWRSRPRLESARTTFACGRSTPATARTRHSRALCDLIGRSLLVEGRPERSTYGAVARRLLGVDRRNVRAWVRARRLERSRNRSASCLVDSQSRSDP